VLIGGQAVNYWAELSLPREPELGEFRPFTSEDIDFKGDREDVERIAGQLGLQPVYPRPIEMTALAGVVPFKIGTIESNIEVVLVVPGIPEKLIEGFAIEAEWAGKKIRVLDPISLLYCKVELALRISQENRRDVEHVEILVYCVRAFLRELLGGIESGRFPAKGWFGATKRIMKLAQSAKGRKAAERLGVVWQRVLPVAEIARSGHPQIIRFREQRLSRWKPPAPTE